MLQLQDGEFPGRGAGTPLVVALHCSAGTPRQWRALGERLPSYFAFLAPDLIGSRVAGGWDGSGPFTLAQEASGIVAAIDAHQGPIHLVGHSYGGGVALRIAADRCDRIASLSLYEPSAFHMLRHIGAAAGPAFLEIVTLAGDVREGLTSGAYQAAAKQFVDYWNGDGAWVAMTPERRMEMVRYVPKACLDFRALLGDTTAPETYARFAFEQLLMRGPLSPEPSRVIVEALHRRAPDSRQVIIAGAGHMGPLTHGAEVAELIAEHIQRAHAGWRGRPDARNAA